MAGRRSSRSRTRGRPPPAQARPLSAASWCRAAPVRRRRRRRQARPGSSFRPRARPRSPVRRPARRRQGPSAVCAPAPTGPAAPRTASAAVVASRATARRGSSRPYPPASAVIAVNRRLSSAPASRAPRNGAVMDVTRDPSAVASSIASHAANTPTTAAQNASASAFTARRSHRGSAARRASGSAPPVNGRRQRAAIDHAPARATVANP